MWVDADGDATDARVRRQRVGGARGGDKSHACGRESLIGRQSIRNFDAQRLTESAFDGRFAELERERRDRGEQEQPERTEATTWVL